MPGSDDMIPAGKTDPRLKLTYDDFLLFPDDGKRHELIDGEHYATPSPGLRHQAISGRLHLLIGNWLADHPRGRLFYAPLDVLFSRFDVVEPDLLYVSNERAPELLAGQNVTGSPDLVIEIGSPEHAQPRRDHQASPVPTDGRHRVLERRSRDRCHQDVPRLSRRSPGGRQPAFSPSHRAVG